LAESSSLAETPRWTGFLGPERSLSTADSLPLTWSPEENIAWRVEPTGFGQSSPVIWGDKVFVTSVEGDDKEKYHTTAYALADGKKLWQHTIDSTLPVENTNYVSRAAPTPAVDADSLYVLFESGDLLALSHDGEQRWKRSLSKDYGKFDSRHGLAASPLLTDAAVVVLVDHDGPAYIMAAKKSDGSTLWKTERASRISWSSPTLIKAVDGKSQIVVSSNGSVDGYDPTTGKQLWTLDNLGGNTVASATPFGNGCFVVGASTGRSGEATEGATRTNIAVCLEQQGEKHIAKTLWTAEKATSSFGSPVVHDGVGYWVNKSGVLFGLDAKTGETLFTERLPDSTWATPLAVDDRVYLFMKKGETTSIKAGKQFEVLAENKLWDPTADAGPQTLYGVAAVEGVLLIRTGERLYCLRKP